MIHSRFRSYQIAVSVHQEVRTLKVPAYLRDQLLRAASSVCLNLAEGSGKDSPLDRRRFYNIALGSVREVQAILDLAEQVPASLSQLADQLGASVYLLCNPRS